MFGGSYGRLSIMDVLVVIINGKMLSKIFDPNFILIQPIVLAFQIIVVLLRGSFIDGDSSINVRLFPP